MKRTLHTILLLLVATVTFAQSYPRKCTEEDIPSSERQKYIDEVKHYITNYYMQIPGVIGDMDNQEYLIEHLMADSETVSLKMEFLLSGINNMTPVSPAQYFSKFDMEYKEIADEIDFVVDNISNGNIMMKTGTSCYIPVDYDLTAKKGDEVLFKRRCRMFCLFPRIAVSKNVKTMQVEPVKNIIAYVRPKAINGTPKVSINSAKAKANSAAGSITDDSKTVAKVLNDFDFIGKYSNSGLAVFRKDGKYGFINKKNKVVVPAKYEAVGCNYLWQEEKSGNDSIQWGYSILMSVSKNNKWGFVNKSGIEIVPCIYDKVDVSAYIDDRPTWVCKDNKYGCVDTLGNLVIPIKYEYKINFYGDEPCKTKLNGKWGFIDKKGNGVIPFVYDDTRGFGWNGDTAPVCKNNKYGFINRDGIEFIPVQYEFVDNFSNGRAGVVKDGKLGFIDKEGKIVIPFIYEPAYTYDGDGKMLKWCMSFKRSVALVRLNGKYGLINFQGEKITDFKYDDVGAVNSTAQYEVYLGNKVIYIDRKGNEYSSQQEREEKSDSILANQGDRIAQFDYALKLYKAEMYDKSYGWFKKAYENGNTDAIVYIAESHYFGRGVHKSYADALPFFRLAAGVGDRHAVYMLAWMAEHGQGLPIDVAKAIKNYKRCGDFRDAEERLKNLEKQYNNGHDFVDLGLSVKWATCNIGASKPEEFGDLFAWGETKTKEFFTKDNSRNYKKKFGLSINGSYLDAASANMGGKWKMPTKTEWIELILKCTWDVIKSNDVIYHRVTGPNGNYILLPIKAFDDFDYWDYYWSANPKETKKTAYAVMNSMKSLEEIERYHGCYIRAVIE